MSGGLVTVGEFGDQLQAELFQVRLEQEGIKAVVVGASLLAEMPYAGMPHIDVQVRKEDEEKTKAILEMYLDECDANAGEDIGDEDEDDDEVADAGDDAVQGGQ
ncbi:MAG: DUF2007 domain-containing protein [Anaerohalosphaera sp.]|nr:DUF2007 domain-containing protein [Anaerohalosphaera sp.]